MKKIVVFMFVLALAVWSCTITDGFTYLYGYLSPKMTAALSGSAAIGCTFATCQLFSGKLKKLSEKAKIIAMKFEDEG